MSKSKLFQAIYVNGCFYHNHGSSCLDFGSSPQPEYHVLTGNTPTMQRKMDEEKRLQILEENVEVSAVKVFWECEVKRDLKTKNYTFPDVDHCHLIRLAQR